MKRNDDLTLSFVESTHTYTCSTGDAFHSVTETIDTYFSKFNANVAISNTMSSRNWSSSEYYGMTSQEIKDLWKENANKGTRMHACIEAMLKECCIETDRGPKLDLEKLQKLSVEVYTNIDKAKELVKEWPEILEGELITELRYFSDFTFEEFPKWSKIYCLPEFRVFSPELKIAGTIDLLLYNEEGDVCIYDWKRVGKMRLTNGYRRGKGPFADVDDCNYRHYQLQLNLYRYILQTNYTLQDTVPSVSVMRLYIFHPNNPGYASHEIERETRVSLIKVI